MTTKANASMIQNIPIRASILHWNRPDECLKTISHLNSSGLNIKITVVDNNSRPSEISKLKEHLPDKVGLIQLPTNVGWGRAHNVILKKWLSEETDSPYCLICAHDPIPIGKCLEDLIRALEENPDLGLVSPVYDTFELPCYSIVKGAYLKPVSKRVNGTVEAAAYCHGTLAAFRRECIQEIGLFDEGYFAYGDETEIGIRANRFGWKVGIVWGAILNNPGSWSGNAVIGYLWTRSSLRMARKFYGLAGLCIRLSYISFVTFVLWLKGSPKDSVSSPKGRSLAIWDYLIGYQGSPKKAVLQLQIQSSSKK